MASILESLGQFATPELVGQVGKMVGMDDETVNKAVGVAGPLLLGALGQKAATPAGATDLLGSLADTDGGLMDALGSGNMGGLAGVLIGAMSSGSSDNMLASLLGPGRQAIEGVVEQRFGIKIGPVLAFAAPLILGFLSKTAKDQGLGANGLASLLRTETAQFAATNADTAGLISSALEAGDRVNQSADRTRQRFSTDEWTTLVHAPLRVGAALMAASASGAGGMSKELMALSHGLIEGSNQAKPDSLLGVLNIDLRAVATQLTSGGAAADEVKRLLAIGSHVGAETSQEVATIVAAKAAPEDATSYKQWLMQIAQSVAAASKEGGFLGIGGQQVDDKERAALQQISAALGVTTA